MVHSRATKAQDHDQGGSNDSRGRRHDCHHGGARPVGVLTRVGCARSVAKSPDVFLISLNTVRRHRDPGEQTNVSAGNAALNRELLARLTAWAKQSPPSADLAEIDPSVRGRLESLGYVGD